MPKKNPEAEDLNTYKVHFVDKATENFHTSDTLIKTLSKADAGGYHPIASGDDEWLINMDNVLWIENITPVEPTNV